MNEREKDLVRVLRSVAASIDWNQQSSSCYFIGEDAAQDVLMFLGFDWNNGISNESVAAHLAGLEGG